MAHRLEATISDALWAALQERAVALGQPVGRVVQEALADALDLTHHSMFQVSTSAAMVEGLYQGALTVGDLRRHGDTGLGTFEGLDGEMVLVDGHCYQARSDGSVSIAPNDALTPFATVVSFAAETSQDLNDVASFGDLTARLDAMRTSDNDFFAWRLAGTCSELRLRAACRHASGTPLVVAVADQAVFELADVPVDIVGFWSPAYAEAVAIPGYHLHAVSQDRARGGHVFDLRSPRLTAQVHRVSDLRLALPETEEFLQARLSGDVAHALDASEHDAQE